MSYNVMLKKIKNIRIVCYRKEV